MRRHGRLSTALIRVNEVRVRPLGKYASADTRAKDVSTEQQVSASVNLVAGVDRHGGPNLKGTRRLAREAAGNGAKTEQEAFP